MATFQNEPSPKFAAHKREVCWQLDNQQASLRLIKEKHVIFYSLPIIWDYLSFNVLSLSPVCWLVDLPPPLCNTSIITTNGSHTFIPSCKELLSPVPISLSLLWGNITAASAPCLIPPSQSCQVMIYSPIPMPVACSTTILQSLYLYPPSLPLVPSTSSTYTTAEWSQYLHHHQHQNLQSLYLHHDLNLYHCHLVGSYSVCTLLWHALLPSNNFSITTNAISSIAIIITIFSSRPLVPPSLMGVYTIINTANHCTTRVLTALSVPLPAPSSSAPLLLHQYFRAVSWYSTKDLVQKDCKEAKVEVINGLVNVFQWATE